MEEIKVGEYIRTKDGYIGKYVKDGLVHKTIEIEDNEMSWITGEWNISKHSPNIIDIIEEGDYVNGDKVDMINTCREEKELLCNDYNLDDSVIVYKNKEIETIVTHEQFKSIEYEV